MRSTLLSISVLILLSLLGAQRIGQATKPGIGISPDSVTYIAAARNIKAGKGVVISMPNGQDLPLNHFPPMYPAFLAFVSALTGQDAVSAGHGLAILLFTLNLFLIGWWVYERGGHSLLNASLAVVLSAFAIDLLRVHSMMWSEQAFILLMLLSFWFLGSYLEKDSVPALVLSALFAAVAWLTRYAGVSLVTAGTLSVLFLSKDRSRVWKNTAIFALCSGGPMALWLLRNILLVHNATTRVFAVHPLFGVLLAAGKAGLGLWFFQTRSPNALTTGISLAFLAGVVTLFLLFKRKSSPFSRMLLIFSGLYVLMIAVIVFFFEADLIGPEECDRMLSPLHVALVIAFFIGLSQCEWPRLLRYTIQAALVGFTGFVVVSGQKEIQRLAQDGQQYASAAWQTSPTLAILKEIPAGLHIYTNGAKPVYIYTNRLCFDLPPKISIGTLRPNADYDHLMWRIRSEVDKKLAVVVYFSAEQRPEFPTPMELKDYFRTPVRQTTDGLIFHS